MQEHVEQASPSPDELRGATRSPRNILAGACLVAVALFALWASWELPAGRLGAIGPGMIPRTVAVLLGASGAVLLVLGLLRRGEGLGAWSLRAPLFVVLGLVAFALTIRSPGLSVAAPVLVLVSGAATPETRPRELVIFAVAITAFCVGLFRFALQLPIPILVIPGVVHL